MSSVKILISFLSCFIISSSLSVKAEGHFKKEITPLSHTYTQDLLKGIREKQPKISTLPTSESSVVFLPVWNLLTRPLSVSVGYLSGNPSVPLSFSTGVIFSYAILQTGYDGDSPRGNLILGRLYKSPFYGRVGFDYIPIGRHASEVFAPQDIITRSRLRVMGCISEFGSSYLSESDEWQWSVAGFANDDFRDIDCEGGIVKLQYAKNRIANFDSIERYIVGGGLGRGSSLGELGLLFNLYGDVSFSKGWNSCIEYMYDNWSKYRDAGKNALHAEVNKHFRQIPITQWNAPWSLTGGIELGNRISENALKPQRKVFGAGKIQLWKKRITLVLGGEWNVVDGKGLQPLARLGISL